MLYALAEGSLQNPLQLVDTGHRLPSRASGCSGGRALMPIPKLPRLGPLGSRWGWWGVRGARAGLGAAQALPEIRGNAGCPGVLCFPEPFPVLSAR